MGEWQGVRATGLLAVTGECCERPNLFVVSTILDEDVLAGLLRCATCERFCAPRPIGRDGAFGPPGWGKSAVWRFSLYRAAVQRAYCSGSSGVLIR